MKIAIFPGHHGKDPGAIDPATGPGDNLHTVESAITTSIASKMSLFCKCMNLPHVLACGDWVNRLDVTRDCTVGVDIHCDIAINAPGVRGYHAIHHPGSNKGRDLAMAVDEALSMFAGRSRAIHGEDLFILRKTQFPTVLVECGFLSNFVDETMLMGDAYQYKMAFGILSGILGWAHETV